MADESKPNLLIVDDEPHVRQILTSLLEAEEYACAQAGSAEEAKKILKERTFALVLLDIKMPGDSGLDLLQYIMWKYPDTSVVMVSGMEDPGVAKMAIEHGAYGYVIKPFEAHDVIINVNNALRRRQLELENKEYRDNLEKKVAQRAHELQRSEQRLRLLIDSIAAGILIIDKDSHEITDANPAAVDMLGFERSALIGKTCHDTICPYDTGDCPVNRGVVFDQADAVLLNSQGEKLPVLKTIKPIIIHDKKHLLVTIIDISALKAMEKRVVQAEKMESLGQLAAGIAHEINTPTQYIGDNTRFLGDAFPDLDSILERLEDLIDAEQNDGPIGKLIEDIQQLIEDVDLEFLREEIPHAIEQTLEGVERISKIVSSMKQFAHPGSEEKSRIDINEAIDKTITVARNEWKYVADMETRLEEGLPLVPCVQGEINQVLLNLVINAAHAIADAVSENSDKRGKITISSRRNGDWIEIGVADTGTGIPEDVQARIFDPFFTTKQVGKGTGQGLAIAHRVVVEKHHGKIDVDTTPGKGTTFTIHLPLEPQEAEGLPEIDGSIIP